MPLWDTIRQTVLKSGSRDVESINAVQAALTKAGYPVAVNGQFVPNSDFEKTLEQFQVDNNIASSGWVGPITCAALDRRIAQRGAKPPVAAPVVAPVPTGEKPDRVVEHWPHDDEDQLEAFYGDPDAEDFSNNLTMVEAPFPLTYSGRPVKGVQIHKKCAASLLAVFQDINDHYGGDLAALQASGITKFSGSYNNRSVRGSTKKSCHAFGAAIDIDAEHNSMYYDDGGEHHFAMPEPVITAFKNHGWYWGGDFHHRKDPMHFQAAHEGEANA